MILPDRNIISEIAGRFENGKKNGRTPDFLDLFEDEPVHVNPLLYAIEGNCRTLPDPTMARIQLEEVVAKLGRALPKAVLMIGPQSLTGLLGLIEDTRPGLARMQAFLRKVAPALAAPVARVNIERRWREVLDAADACGVSFASLVVLATLSTLVNPGKCAAKKLLKFHAGYSDADAYNALCDLRSLDLLIHCLAFFPEHDTQLCTADRNLALFWTGVDVTNISRNGHGISFTMTPHEALLPGSYGERWADAINNA